jgi:hypothetical protein
MVRGAPARGWEERAAPAHPDAKLAQPAGEAGRERMRSCAQPGRGAAPIPRRRSGAGGEGKDGGGEGEGGEGKGGEGGDDEEGGRGGSARVTERDLGEAILVNSRASVATLSAGARAVMVGPANLEARRHAGECV